MYCFSVRGVTRLLALRLMAAAACICAIQIQVPAADNDASKVIEEIRSERRWKDRVTEPTPEFLSKARADFDHWAQVLATLSSENRQTEADQIVSELVALRNYWGSKIFPQDNFNAFVRDTFYVKGAKVVAAQFFEPVEFYKGDPNLLKYYRFSVYDGDNVVMRYYLERSQMIEPYFVLGRMSPDNKHKQVQPYGSKMPSYWTLRTDTITDLSR